MLQHNVSLGYNTGLGAPAFGIPERTNAYDRVLQVC